MKRLIALTLILAAAGQAGFTARAATADLPEAVQSLPAGSRFVFSVDVKRIVASPLYSRFAQKELDSFRTKFQRVFNEIGFDPELDLERVSGASHSGADGKESFIIIASGSFDRAAIIRTLLRSPGTVEKEYGKLRILTIPGRAETKNVELSVVFLNDREMAAGGLEAVESFLDTREKKKTGIMSDPMMTALLAGVRHEDMIWFAGDAAAASAAGIAGSANLPDALIGNTLANAVNAAASITNITGSINATDALAGTVTINTVDAAAAGKLADMVATMTAFARLAGDGDSQAKLLLDGFSFSRAAERITFNLKYTSAFFDQLEKTKR